MNAFCRLESGGNGFLGKFLAFPLLWFILGAVGLCLHFAAWPLVFHLVLIPSRDEAKTGFRVEYFQSRAPDGQVIAAGHFSSADFSLPQPDSSLRADALWEVPKAGLYHLRLTCDDAGHLSLDGEPLTVLHGISAKNQGQAMAWLDPGPHLLSLSLENGPGAGRLTLEVRRPGEEAYGLLAGPELGYPDLGNLSLWLGLAHGQGQAGLWTALACLIIFTALVVWRPATAPGIDPAPLGLAGRLRLAASLLCLAVFLALPAQLDTWLDGLPMSGRLETGLLAGALPLLLLLGWRVLASRWLLIGAAALLCLKLALFIGAPQAGWGLIAYDSLEDLQKGRWEPTYKSLWQSGLSGVLTRPVHHGLGLPIGWQIRKANRPMAEALCLEVEGSLRLPKGAGLALAARGVVDAGLKAIFPDGSSRTIPLLAEADLAGTLPFAELPQGEFGVRGVLAYGGTPVDEWTLILLLVWPDGAWQPVCGRGILWCDPAGPPPDGPALAVWSLAGWATDLGFIGLLALWSLVTLRGLWQRGWLSPAIVCLAGAGAAATALLWGLGFAPRGFLAVGAGVSLLGLAVHLARSKGDRPVGWLTLMVAAPAVLGWFLLAWLPLAGRAWLPPFAHDFGVYQNYAYQIAVMGDWWHRAAEVFYFMPLYRYVAAVLHAFFGQSPLAQNFLDVWAALGGAAALAALARRLGARAGWAMAAPLIYLFAELSGDFGAQMGSGLQEHAATLFMLLAALAASRRPGGASLLAAGICGALCYWLRQDYLGVLAGVGLFSLGALEGGGLVPAWRELWARGKRQWWWLGGYWLILAGAVLAIFLRHYLLAGKWVLTHPGKIGYLAEKSGALASLSAVLNADPEGLAWAGLILWPGTLAGILALVWRWGPLARYPLSLGAALLGLLAPYAYISRALQAYPPRASIHLLPLASLSLALLAGYVWDWLRRDKVPLAGVGSAGGRKS